MNDDPTLKFDFASPLILVVRVASPAAVSPPLFLYRVPHLSLAASTSVPILY